MDSFRRPLGLVLPAGGAHGSWQAAALQVLASGHGLHFDSVLGFSAGALTGAAYTLGLLGDALRRWRAIDGGILRLAPRLFPLSLFSDRPIWESVDYALDDEQARKRTRCRFVVVTSRTKRDRHVQAVFSPEGRQGWDAPMGRHLVASCSIPLIFPPVNVDFRGEDLRLFDGGVPCEQPMSSSELAGCRDIIVLEMVRPEEVGRLQGGLLREFDQKARETVRRLVNQGLASLKGLADPPRIFRLAPSKPIEFMMLSFRAANIRPALEQGEADARAFISRPLDYLEA